MLTVTAPIKTVINPDLCESNESFAKRIIANYDQMSEFITREDLFHVVTQPPEVFLVDGGGNSFLSETEIRNTQLKKVEIINNLMNRILVSADSNLTYRDEVYITNVLHKLGIRDERTFMKNVYNLLEETKEKNELINAYWENREELSQMISFYRMQSKEGDTTEVTESNQEILHLHEDVFNRWMTAAIYRTQNNFRSMGDSNTVINSDSYRMTEEIRLSQQILLQRLRESVRGENVPLIYRHDNYYEQPGDDEASLEPEAISEQIASAVLLSLTDNLYENILYKNNSVGDKFYRTENAFYGAADHVFERMEGNTAYIISEHRAGDVIQELSQQNKTELNAINEILQYYYTGGDEVAQQNLLNEITEVSMQHPEAEVIEREETSTEINVDARNTIEQQLYQTNLRNEQRQQVYMQNLKKLSEKTQKTAGQALTEEEKRKEAEFAFLHPEEFKEQKREEGRREIESAEESISEFIEALPPKTRDVYKVIREYIKNPEIFYGTRIVQKDADMLLIREQLEAEREERLIRDSKMITETIENNTEIENRITDRVQGIEETVGRITPETVRLVHRVNDVTVDEETIENIRREINDIRTETRKVENRTETIETITERQVNNVNDIVINTDNTENITRMIQENLNQQIGNITSKVYDRLERQLMSERRRRGM